MFKYFLLIPHSSKTETVEAQTPGIITQVLDFSHVFLFSQAPLTVHPIYLYNNKKHKKCIPMLILYSNNNSQLIFFKGVYIWINIKCEQKVHSLLQYGKLMLSVYCQKWITNLGTKQKTAVTETKIIPRFLPSEGKVWFSIRYLNVHRHTDY